MWQVKSVARWTHKLALRSLLLAGTATLLAPGAVVPTAGAQISVGIGIQPVCSYGYYDYAPGYAPGPVVVDPGPGYYGYAAPGYSYQRPGQCHFSIRGC